MFLVLQIRQSNAFCQSVLELFRLDNNNNGKATSRATKEASPTWRWRRTGKNSRHPCSRRRLQHFGHVPQEVHGARRGGQICHWTQVGMSSINVSAFSLVPSYARDCRKPIRLQTLVIERKMGCSLKQIIWMEHFMLRIHKVFLSQTADPSSCEFYPWFFKWFQTDVILFIFELFSTH